MIPKKLNKGDEIRIIAPSGSLKNIDKDIINTAISYLTKKGFKLSFSANSDEFDEAESSSIESRICDFHDAFTDKNVRAILSCRGGFNSNQILEYIDYELVKNNPKIFCGYSDITALLNAIYTKTGLITYHGPMLTTFGKIDVESSYDYFEKCLMRNEPYFFNPTEEAKQYFSVV